MPLDFPEPSRVGPFAGRRERNHHRALRGQRQPGRHAAGARRRPSCGAGRAEPAGFRGGFGRRRSAAGSIGRDRGRRHHGNRHRGGACGPRPAGGPPRRRPAGPRRGAAEDRGPAGRPTDAATGRRAGPACRRHQDGRGAGPACHRHQNGRGAGPACHRHQNGRGAGPACQRHQDGRRVRPGHRVDRGNCRGQAAALPTVAAAPGHSNDPHLEHLDDPDRPTGRGARRSKPILRAAFLPSGGPAAPGRNHSRPSERQRGPGRGRRPGQERSARCRSSSTTGRASWSTGSCCRTWARPCSCCSRGPASSRSNGRRSTSAWPRGRCGCWTRSASTRRCKAAGCWPRRFLSGSSPRGCWSP